MSAPVRDPLDLTRKFSEGGAPEHRAALAIVCPSCSATAGQWCPMPGTTWNLCGARIDHARSGPFGGIMLGTPIPSEPPDPSKIIGAFCHTPDDPRFCSHGYMFGDGDPAGPSRSRASDGCVREFPPIPPAGFYWARIAGMGRWEPVEVIEHSNGVRRVAHDGEVAEWGPALCPPGSGVALVPTPVPTPPADAHPLLHVMANAIDGIDRDIARLTAKRAAVLAELTAKLKEWNAVSGRRPGQFWNGTEDSR